LDDVDALERATAGFARSDRQRRVLFAAALDDHDATRLTWRMIALLQALARHDVVDGTRFVALTAHALAVAGEPLRHPGPAALAGLLRVVPREFQQVRAVAVDVDEAAMAEPAVLAARLRRETEASGGELGIAVRGGLRHTQELAPIDAGEASPPAWPRGSTWWISGGLGGIGLRLAEHLARTCAARLVLLSRRGLPPRDLWADWAALRTGDRVAQLIARVRALEELGAEVEVVAADVADRESMANCVQIATTRFGSPFGIVHAAGVLDDGPLLTRTRERTEAMLRPKIEGAMVLDECTARFEPQRFVVFGSTSGLAGIPGQCDYAAANAALDAFAHWRDASRPGRTVAIDWGIWQDAGMLVQDEQLSMPAPTWLGERCERGGAVEFLAMWSPATHWMIGEHRVRDGDCVMPGTGHVELMVAAVQAVAEAAQVTLEGVEFRTPLAFPGDAPRAVVVQVRARSGGYQVVVASAASERHEEHERSTHAQAFARVGAAGDAVLDVPTLRAAAPTECEPESDQARHVAFGPRWRCIERVAVGDGHVFAELHLPEPFAADLDEHKSHAALLDMAFGCGIRLLSAGHDDALFVPVGCERIVVHGRLPARLVSSVRLRDNDAHARLGTLDVTLATPGGVVVAELLGLSLYGVRGNFGGATASAEAPAKVAVGSPTPTQEPKAPTPRIAAILARGITAPEGMAGFERALATGLPRVVVSSLDVARTADWLALPPAAPRPVRIEAGDERADTAAEAPRDDTERALATAFSELLGVDAPGIDDDFFELGGHSLLAVRLFARIHKDFGLDLELATLLSAGTVRKLAALVREELSLPEPGDAPARSVSAHKGQHVVPIQTDGSRPNLFLVHGAGGNVLGFRDLAHYFGKDQPVFGLQARGVDGKQPPHTTIAEMAQAYLAEVREVQPHGPYFLGGYSGGGVVAYEMAQLLRAVGEPVGFVGMIDSWCPQMPRRGRLARALLHTGRMLKKGPMYPIEILRIKLQRRSAARDTERARQEGGTLPQDKRGFEVQFAFENAFAQHVVEPYPGDVWLFKAEDQQHGTRYIVDDKLGWAPFIQGELHVRACPGNHFTMCTEPNVQVLCQHMMAAMDAAIAKVTR
ncbi:MAG TPA: SDR family NAD(P)-dependent oxidoreductase, partial [bacterium]|nr:SDR family NAD(P)-dependent oxidoreductase [bacterium]